MKTRLDRFWAKIKVNRKSGCWLWTGHVAKISGYGQFWNGEKVIGAHVFSFITFKGPLPCKQEPDHLCRVRRCVNPAHLEAVTRLENLMRGHTIIRDRASQTHCLRGHPLSGKNLYQNKNGTRACRTCRHDLNKEWVKNNRPRRRQLDRDHYRRSKAEKNR